MSRKKAAAKPAGNAVANSKLPDGLLNEAPVQYPLADTAVTALQVYHNPTRRPHGNGPWDQEADKIAWVDEATGMGCIILRQQNGTLSGYVGVGPSHPLFGFETDAVPVGISSCVHGSISYGRACEVNRFERKAHGEPHKERYTICHVTHFRLVQEYRTVQTTNDEFAHEDLWWFGFDTDHAGDLVPKAKRDHRRKGDVYRDQDFVYANIIKLACRLNNAADCAHLKENSSIEPVLLPSPDKLAGDE